MDTLRDLFGLDGRVAVVTGASAGLGIEFARALAIAGADVALIARRRERLEALAQELRTLGRRTVVATADLTQSAGIARVVAEISDGLGEIDILVNNAGVAPTGRVENYSAEKWQHAFDVNTHAVFHLCQQVGRRMIARGQGGRVINVTSVLAALGCGIYRNAGYVASKAATENLTRQLAIEWAPHRITVNAIAPAWFPTEMTEGGLAKGDNQARMERATPLGRLGRPEEVRTAVVFLASPMSGYVTGSVVYVDGGWTAW
ncbi:MAG TPA: SDR family oxidoreductase [Candidatus Binatia bacterium]|nr:SDR family oxidoreductase [Candidatus Binatia bacterium]